MDLKNVVECYFFGYFNTPQWVFRVLKYPKKCLQDLTTFFMSTWWGSSKNMDEIEFSRWLFEGRLRQGKNVLPDGLNWLRYFASSSKSQCENSISFIFLESPHQLDMKNVVKPSKHFYGYFNTLETHSGSRNQRWSYSNMYLELWKLSNKFMLTNEIKYY